jgi:hypothetical protein
MISRKEERQIESKAVSMKVSESKDITSPTLLRKENLNSSHYTMSLLQEGFRVGLIDESFLRRIQGDFMLIVKELILRYTQGESTSVKLETAETILHSVYYALDALLSSYDNPESGIALLKTGHVREIYEKGIGLVAACVAETKILFEEIRKNKLEVGLEAYELSIGEDLPEFFRNYGVVFKAHETMCGMDYPLVFDITGVEGIFYIRQYLENLQIETQFCRLFRQADLEKVLANYGRIYRMNYRKSLFNIFELAFNNAVFAVIGGSWAGELRISESQSKRIQKLFRSITPMEIDSRVQEAVATLMRELRITTPELIGYLERYQTIFQGRIANAVENNSLYTLILSDPAEKRSSGGMIFEAGPKMPDEDFRKVVRQIRECANFRDKTNLIRAEIHAVEDLVDIFETDCLMGDEFGAVFSAFNEMELAVLGRIVFFEQLRNKPLDLTEILMERQETEWEWQAQYLKFLRGLSAERLKAIASLVNLVEMSPFDAVQ